MRFKKFLIFFLGGFLLCSCATLSTENNCSAPGKVLFTINQRFEVEHKSCLSNLTSKTWLITISICDDELIERKTNLVCYWNGCKYKLWQIDSPKEWSYVGRFKDLDTLGEFIKLSRPIFSSE